MASRLTSARRNGIALSPFAKLPDELFIQIFRYFSVPDLCNASLVCQAFKNMADRDEIWKHKCNSEHSASVKLHSRSYKQIYIEWMHEKTLRNRKLLELQKRPHRRTACLRRHPPPKYPDRPAKDQPFKPIGGFQQHPNSSTNMTITLSVPVGRIAKLLLPLLYKSSRFREQYQQPAVLKQMIQRYYRFMQLKASQPPDVLLIPTMDIEIIWQTHVLRPEMYRSDCLRLFRRVIDHTLLLKEEEQFFKKQAFLDTCQLYQERFGAEYCSMPPEESDASDQEETYSYWDRSHFSFAPTAPSDYENPFSFTEGDVTMDSQWLECCEKFMYETLYEFFRRDSSIIKNDIDLRPEALHRLMKSYERFLYMSAKYPLKDANGFIPPTYAIDIMWHSHMQEPVKYADDCLRLLGYVMYHDPWPIVDEQPMEKSCKEVDQIWKDEFQCPMERDHLFNVKVTRASSDSS